MTARHTYRVVLVVVCGVILVGGTALGAVLWQIHRSVEASCARAQQAHPHPGDDVAALAAYVLSEAHPLSDRNGAVWTLGRLRDPAVLPALESVYTGESCRHDAILCQYELEKAIRRCGAIPAPMREK
jgi:uncharacterized iron-regulated membrane protein